VPLEELSALLVLLEGDCTSSELAMRIGRDMRATERTVMRLQKQGYATVDVGRVHLTEAGVAHARRMLRPTRTDA
jgi:Mn-dependent DtxR family transcriptional regulator